MKAWCALLKKKKKKVRKNLQSQSKPNVFKLSYKKLKIYLVF